MTAGSIRKYLWKNRKIQDMPVEKQKNWEEEDMNIIRMSGGLGNQMFQYSLYLRLLSLGREVKFDDVTEYQLENARPILLSVFGIAYPKASRQEVCRITDSSMKPWDRLRRLVCGRKSREYQEASVDFDEAVLEKDDSYLCGCFQSEKYFKQIEAEVREAFCFRNAEIPSEIRQKILSLKDRIDHSCAVSIHIRRGDYLQVSEVYGGICTEAYYDAAIRQILEACPEAEFFVFSNDTAWAADWAGQKQEETGRAFTVVWGTTEETGYIDLMLMSRCRHHIIANSSFSWWGAWLNPSAEKLVIAPARWLNTRECRDIYTEGMLRIDAEGKPKTGK